MVEHSTYCKQNATVVCVEAQTFYSNEDEPCQVARDRYNNSIPYWAGGNLQAYCACAVDQTCISTNLACNCADVAGTPRDDSGTYTEKHLLPLTAVLGCDTGHSSEWQQFAVGKLVCWDNWNSILKSWIQLSTT